MCLLCEGISVVCPHLAQKCFGTYCAKWETDELIIIRARSFWEEEKTTCTPTKRKPPQVETDVKRKRAESQARPAVAGLLHPNHSFLPGTVL